MLTINLMNAMATSSGIQLPNTIWLLVSAMATLADLQHYCYLTASECYGYPHRLTTLYYYRTATECYGYPRRLTTLYYYLTASECYGYPRRLTTLLLSDC